MMALFIDQVAERLKDLGVVVIDGKRRLHIDNLNGEFLTIDLSVREFCDFMADPLVDRQVKIEFNQAMHKIEIAQEVENNLVWDEYKNL